MFSEVKDALYKGENTEILDKLQAQKMALRILSFDEFNLDIASRLDMYFMKIDRVIFVTMLKQLSFKHNEDIPFIHKSIEKEDVLMELFKRVAKLYGWSMRELDANIHVLMLLAENKDWVRDMALKVGMTKTQLRKLGIKVEKPKKKVHETVSLSSFLK